MRRELIYASGLLVVLGTLTLSTRAAEAQTTAVGPYYATPSWDQTFACTTPATCPRFVVLSNFGSQAVLDRETGLVWERAPSTSVFTWFPASLHCGNLNVGGRRGWRLPARAELLSLLDESQSDPALPPGHPFTVELFGYWTATTRADTGGAWFVILRNGELVGTISKINNAFHAWCVRGGPGVDAQ